MSTPRPRKTLSADGLYRLVAESFAAIQDYRPQPQVSLKDALLSGFALFSLKDPSLLAFDERRHEGNLRRLFGISRVPSDSRLREILDPTDPEFLRPVFADVFRQAQRGKCLEAFAFLGGHYLLAMDGTGYFASNTVHCPSCLEKRNKTTGEVSYSHQLLGAAIVHPNLREVIPLAPEPIVKQDGSTKNDCERNATKRLLRKIRAEHPHLKFLVIEDGLASNGPHIEEILSHGMDYLLGAKPGDHEFLFAQVIQAHDAKRVQTISGKTISGNRYDITFVNGLMLNESHRHLVVNFLQYHEYDATGIVAKQFSWVTNLEIIRGNAPSLVAGGRCRWKIENETFNTLKNQGYQFEHNFGHGDINLSVVFAMLMMLAFLVDQIVQLACPLFRAVWTKFGSKRALWDNLRSHFRHFQFESVRHLYEVMLLDAARELPPPIPGTG